MTIRNEIINSLDKKPKSGNYERLKSCLITNGGLDPQFDNWFKGVIHSLYYRPNKLVLVLVGDQGIGKSYLIQKINKFSRMCEPCDYIYSNLIVELEIHSNSINISTGNNFTVDFGEYPCDKRLASYCSTANIWVHPQRKDFIVINLSNIDRDKLLLVDFDEMWIELFNTYKLR